MNGLTAYIFLLLSHKIIHLHHLYTAMDIMDTGNSGPNLGNNQGFTAAVITVDFAAIKKGLLSGTMCSYHHGGCVGDLYGVILIMEHLSGMTVYIPWERGLEVCQLVKWLACNTG